MTQSGHHGRHGDPTYQAEKMLTVAKFHLSPWQTPVRLSGTRRWEHKEDLCLFSWPFVAVVEAYQLNNRTFGAWSLYDLPRQRRRHTQDIREICNLDRAHPCGPLVSVAAIKVGQRSDIELLSQHFSSILDRAIVMILILAGTIQAGRTCRFASM